MAAETAAAAAAVVRYNNIVTMHAFRNSNTEIPKHEWFYINGHEMNVISGMDG